MYVCFDYSCTSGRKACPCECRPANKEGVRAPTRALSLARGSASTATLNETLIFADKAAGRGRSSSARIDSSPLRLTKGHLRPATIPAPNLFPFNDTRPSRAIFSQTNISSAGKYYWEVFALQTAIMGDLKWHFNGFGTRSTPPLFCSRFFYFIAPHCAINIHFNHYCRYACLGRPSALLGSVQVFTQT